MMRLRLAALNALVFATALLAGCAETKTVETPLATPEPASAPPHVAGGTIRASRAEELIGQSAKGLRALLGPPTLLRNDHGAQLWQYAGRSCTLLAYLYPNAKGEAEVSYVDARAKSSGAVPVADCLAALAHDGKLAS